MSLNCTGNLYRKHALHAPQERPPCVFVPGICERDDHCGVGQARGTSCEGLRYSAISLISSESLRIRESDHLRSVARPSWIQWLVDARISWQSVGNHGVKNGMEDRGRALPPLIQNRLSVGVNVIVKYSLHNSRRQQRSWSFIRI